MSSLKIDYPHNLPAEDARARIRALGEYLSNRHGIGVTWTNDREAQVRGKYMVVSIEGKVVLGEGVVHFEGKDPGFLWRAKAKDYLTGKLARYLDPKVPVEALPRG